MDDGTQIAVDVWLPLHAELGPVPTVMRFGRYWRDYELPKILGDALGRYPKHVSWLNAAGYAVVMVDVRGSGASFGTSTTPWSPREIQDYLQVVDWALDQPWCDGNLGAYGVSYDGVAADWLAALKHPAVRAVLSAYPYADVYRDVSHPGGLLNDRFIRAWGDLNYAMDRNDPSFIDILASADPASFFARAYELIEFLFRGVRPVEDNFGLLIDALADHQANTHVYEATRTLEFRDDAFEDVTIDAISPLLGAPDQQRTAAIRRVVGWLDAGTARGALASYNTLDCAHHVLVIAPQNHSGSYVTDPYNPRSPAQVASMVVINDLWRAVPFFDQFLTATPTVEPRREIYYYTYVDNVFQRTTVWPPAGIELQRWYLAADDSLSTAAPADEPGTDTYTVDFSVTTGSYNRWFSGLAGAPIHYPDRAVQDQRLLVYDSPPFEVDVELTGHPVLSLQVASTYEDGAFIAYLEDVAPDGYVAYLSEGQLRAVQRRVSDQVPPVAIFGPYHTFRREDAQPLVPGEVAEITFDLLPISTVIRAGHRVRLALSGQDAGTFRRYPDFGTPTWTVHRNAVHASYIDLPLKPR